MVTQKVDCSLGIINNLPVPPPEEKPLDKVREHPPKRRSREREER